MLTGGQSHCGRCLLMSRAWYLGITRGPLHHPQERRPHDPFLPLFSTSSLSFSSSAPLSFSSTLSSLSSASLRHPRRPSALRLFPRRVLCFSRSFRFPVRLGLRKRRFQRRSATHGEKRTKQKYIKYIDRKIGENLNPDRSAVRKIDSEARLTAARTEKSTLSSPGIWIPFMVMPCLCVDSRRRFRTRESMQIRRSQRLNFIWCV